MTGQSLPLLLLAASLVPAIVILALREEQARARTTVNLVGAVIKLALVGALLVGTARGATFEWRAAFLPQADLVLRVAPLPLLFVSLSALLWLATTIYAIGYLEGAPHRSRFFAFFSLCVTATVGIALAGNPITFLVFYELLTISTYPLIVHRGTDSSLRAGRTYLLFLVPGGAILLVAVAWLHAIAGPVEFAAGGTLSEVARDHPDQLAVILIVFLVGLGFKAAIVPLHGWLPVAMVAPAPVSALLHAVAVVKAGAYGIILIVFDLYGIELAGELGGLRILLVAACITIIYGSVRALAEDELKRRLAFSTVSQVSYIALGVALATPAAAIGAFAHLVHQGLMKVTLFYCAGTIAETRGLHRISELDGIGRRMPVTMTCFTIAALGMIGIPPIAGFTSKWYLGLGALDAGRPEVVAVLVASTVLNAAYFLPIIGRAWRAVPVDPDEPVRRTRLEAPPALLVPLVATAAASLLVGVFAAWDASPLGWARLLAESYFPAGEGIR
jgi:multicomponent Na+:H+ antiporter subunit D